MARCNSIVYSCIYCNTCWLISLSNAQIDIDCTASLHALQISSSPQSWSAAHQCHFPSPGWPSQRRSYRNKAAQILHHQPWQLWGYQRVWKDRPSQVDKKHLSLLVLFIRLGPKVDVGLEVQVLREEKYSPFPDRLNCFSRGGQHHGTLAPSKKPPCPCSLWWQRSFLLWCQCLRCTSSWKQGAYEMHN